MASSQVEEIKQKLDIVTLVSRYLTLKKRGRHYLACCPFHSEKTPSFTISPELQIFKCFGCGKSGDIFSFVQEYDHLSFPEALEELGALAGVKIEKTYQTTKEEQLQKRLIDLNLEAAKFYHHILTKHPLGKPALDYVLSRGITPQTINLFRIGFSPQNSDLIINYLRKKDFTVAELIASGTYGQSQYGSRRYYDRFQNRLVFPLTDYRDRILGFSGRIMPNNPNPNMAKYINSPETPIYHKSQMLFGLNLAKDAIRTEGSVIVVEGEFDMVSPFQSGIQNIVALKGTAFTPEQLQLLRRYTGTIIFALDSDFAGNNAARKSIELADSMEFDMKVLTLDDKYKDPDEAVKADPEFFKKQLKNAASIWDFIIKSSVTANDVSTNSGKVAALNTVLPFLAKINNPVIRVDYLHKFANAIGSDEDAVMDLAKKYSAPSAAPTSQVSSASASTYTAAAKNNQIVMAVPAAAKTAPAPPSPYEKIEEELLVLLFGAKKPSLLADKLKEHLKFVQSPRFKPIVASLLTSTADFDPTAFLSSLPAELHEIFQNLYLKATEAEIESKERSSQIKKLVIRLESGIIKNQLSHLTQKIAQAEITGDQNKLEELEKEYNKLLAILSNLQVKNI